MGRLLRKSGFSEDNKPTEQEPIIDNIKFRKHKFSNRPMPDIRNIIILPMFSEFGCETLAVLYCIPKLLSTKFSGKYTIVMGWQGREYFYRHLVDEFWELGEEYQWLRTYSKAFHHESRNLKRVEKEAKFSGMVVPIEEVSSIAIYPELTRCPHCESPITPILNQQTCMKCGVAYPQPGLFARLPHSKQEARWLPLPSAEAMARAKKYLPPNAVGVTARLRKTYGRNLQPIFYERLIYLLEDLGYNIVWIGEKSTSMSCPFDRIIDFSSSEDANDLETTLAVVSQLKFTIQFWTASTRLAGMMGTPFILVESPDQLYGAGQEGMRLNLCSKGEKKLIISHFRNIYEDNTAGLELIKKAVRQAGEGNYSDIVGMVENKYTVEDMRINNLRRIGAI